MLSLHEEQVVKDVLRDLRRVGMMYTLGADNWRRVYELTVQDAHRIADKLEQVLDND